MRRKGKEDQEGREEEQEAALCGAACPPTCATGSAHKQVCVPALGQRRCREQSPYPGACLLAGKGRWQTQSMDEQTAFKWVTWVTWVTGWSGARRGNSAEAWRREGQGAGKDGAMEGEDSAPCGCWGPGVSAGALTDLVHCGEMHTVLSGPL